ncbi:hypothetical protein RUM44_007016 [Polyplax serrata]|uniref:Uncharacterized protein n=1 Tax=Polyplax serrata TaxID=468196 RepID=A0ABR1AZL1_POLSC
MLAVRGSFAQNVYHQPTKPNADARPVLETPLEPKPFSPRQMAFVKQDQRLSQTGNGQSEHFRQTEQQNRNYIQKMANQLFLAQKHVPLLSDYQRYILGQDPLVKKYVFGNQDVQQRSQTGQPVKSQFIERSLYPSPQARSFASTKSVTKSKAASEEKTPPKQSADSASQSSELQYTLQPAGYLSYGTLHKLVPEVTLLKPAQPLYYGLGGAHSYEFKTAPTIDLGTYKPTVTSLSHFDLDSYKSAYPLNHKHLDEDYGHGENYQFSYDVKDPNKHSHFGQTETRTDDKTVGKYYLQLPDGRFETVNYWADKNGYHAKVEFTGRSIHPQYEVIGKLI